MNRVKVHIDRNWQSSYVAVIDENGVELGKLPVEKLGLVMTGDRPPRLVLVVAQRGFEINGVIDPAFVRVLPDGE